MSASAASRMLRNWKFRRMMSYLGERGITFNRLPSWQRRGIALYWKAFRKKGINPLTGRQVLTTRFRLVMDDNLPLFTSRQGRKLVLAALKARARAHR